MKSKQKLFLLISLLLLTFFFSREVMAEKEEKDNKPTNRFQQTLDKVNKYSDSAEVNADKSLKKLDKIYELLSKYYKKASRDKIDLNIEEKIKLIAQKKEETKEKFKDAKDEIKEFKKAEKGLAGATNQLRVRALAFVQSFNEYKTMLMELTAELKPYSQNPSPEPSLSPTPTPSESPEISPSPEAKGDDE